MLDRLHPLFSTFRSSSSDIRRFAERLYLMTITRLAIVPANNAANTRERGASLVEYALLIALIALVCVSALIFLGQRPSGPINTVGSAISS